MKWRRPRTTQSRSRTLVPKVYDYGSEVEVRRVLSSYKAFPRDATELLAWMLDTEPENRLSIGSSRSQLHKMGKDDEIYHGRCCSRSKREMIVPPSSVSLFNARQNAAGSGKNLLDGEDAWKIIENDAHLLPRLADMQLQVAQLGHQSVDENVYTGDNHYPDENILDSSATAWSYTSIQQYPSAAAPLEPRALLNRWPTAPNPMSHPNYPSHDARMEKQPEQAHEIARMNIQDPRMTPQHGIFREKSEGVNENNNANLNILLGLDNIDPEDKAFYTGKQTDRPPFSTILHSDKTPAAPEMSIKSRFKALRASSEPAASSRQTPRLPSLIPQISKSHSLKVHNHQCGVTSGHF